MTDPSTPVLIGGTEVTDPVRSLEAARARTRPRSGARPDWDLPTYRLLSVTDFAGGVAFEQMAAELGISARHARRLYHRPARRLALAAGLLVALVRLGPS
jgi:hypothetical protein